MALSSLYKQLLNDFQQDLPLTPRPFLSIANILGVTEEEVMSAFQVMTEQGFIHRIGAVIRPNRIGKSMLVAMRIPQDRLTEVADMISRLPEVNHNYERDNELNLWFVLVAEDSRHLQQVIEQIERQTQLKTLQFPLLEDYYINLGFDLELD